MKILINQINMNAPAANLVMSVNVSVQPFHIIFLDLSLCLLAGTVFVRESLKLSVTVCVLVSAGEKLSHHQLLLVYTPHTWGTNIM